ncbi:MAG: LicD family protein, partial [Campylobacterota bacterium]|nr:LicD family protein [Campylobacterota bacterium]
IAIKSLDKLHLGWDNNINASVIYGGEMPDVAAVFDYEAVYPLKKMKFEEIEFFVPNDCDHYLKAIYSDGYMEIPPKEKQTVHAAKIIIGKN